ncbi:MAG: hypothetical protein R3331_03520 [Sulfurospirillaceae bacterium]|nr:hypothetical protein [Sulfurospirillaceae bacterium]
MISLSNSYIVKVLTKLLILLAIAKILSLALWWFLPSEGVELQIKHNYMPSYQKVDFKNMFDPSSSKTSSQNKIKTAPEGASITNMVLKGLYGIGSKGFAVVALRSSQNITSIISVGEDFSGYTLKTILHDSVVFKKGFKDYILKIESSNISKQTNLSSGSSETQMEISRRDVNEYTNNPNKIWRDISIIAVQNGNNIEGFRVTHIRMGSKMQNLGLRVGDIIIRANNIDLKSYKDALDIYRNIGKIRTMQIVVKRNNQYKELVYEIN